MKSSDGRFQYLALDRTPLPDGSRIEDAHRFAFRCRSTPTVFCDLNLRGKGHDLEKRSWTLTGTIDQPTLAPSIDCKDCWHGFIEDGVFLTTKKTPEKKQ